MEVVRSTRMAFSAGTNKNKLCETLINLLKVYSARYRIRQLRWVAKLQRFERIFISGKIL